MKKTFTFLFLLVTSAAFTQAQPTLNSFEPSSLLGKQLTYYLVDSTIDPYKKWAINGFNQTFDINQITVYNNTKTIYTYIDPATAKGTTHYPTANVAYLSSVDSSIAFVNLSNTYLQNLGTNGAKNFTTLGGDTIMKFPENTDDFWFNRYTGKITTGVKSTTIYDTSLTIANMAGTLISPTGTNYPVLLLTTYDKIIYYPFIGLPTTYTDTVWNWVAQDFAQPIFTISHNWTLLKEVGGNFLSEKRTATALLTVTQLPTNTNNIFTPALNVYPVPANNKIYIDPTKVLPANSNVIIYNMVGQQAMEIKLNGTHDLDIANLPAGCYYGVITDEKAAAYRFKFIKQ